MFGQGGENPQEREGSLSSIPLGFALCVPR